MLVSVDSWSESSENNESCVGVSVGIDPWLGQRPIANGELLRGLGG